MMLPPVCLILSTGGKGKTVGLFKGMTSACLLCLSLAANNRIRTVDLGTGMIQVSSCKLATSLTLLLLFSAVSQQSCFLPCSFPEPMSPECCACRPLSAPRASAALLAWASRWMGRWWLPTGEAA